MAAADGQLLTLNLTLTIWGVRVRVRGTVEVMHIRREV